MRKITGIAAALAAAGMAMAMPAHAATASDAEQLRRLDIMLMVTGLRCRTTPDNFQSDFAAFEASHMSELNAASRELRDSMVARNGVVGANRALDRISTGMANAYGQGHPWLDCAQLKQVTRTLARMKGREVLVEAADQLLAPNEQPVLAFAGR